ncbi:MAG TPA: hypothetical protein VK835_02140 [Bacteroidia bacterium]|nr:hypothetical protein [Bacteroidia bacterium]
MRKIKSAVVNLLLALSFISLFGCRDNTVRHIAYFIPKGYLGYVNIIHDDSKSSSHIVRKGDNYTYFITGNPLKYSVNDKFPHGGYYDVKYFYYSKEDTIELYDDKYELCQIFLQANKSMFTYDKSGKKIEFKFESFYIADKPYTIEGFYNKFKPLPENNCCQ